MLKVLAFVLPLGLDSFAVAAALGAARPMTAGERLRISALFMAFEGGMPLIGLGLGATTARAVGTITDYLAATTLFGLAAWILLSDHSEAEEIQAGQLASVRGLAIIGLGISISLDELAIGFSFGLARLPSPSSSPSLSRHSWPPNSGCIWVPASANNYGSGPSRSPPSP